MPHDAHESATDHDGRTLRRAHNREAVINTVLALLDEGHFEPAVAQIVERSQLSERSIFRYFEHLDDLGLAVVQRILERGTCLLALDAMNDVALKERVRKFVAIRIRFCEAQRWVGRLALSHEHDVPAIAIELNRFRSVLRAQIADLFHPELVGLPRRVREQVLAAIFVLSTFESWDLHSRVVGFSRTQLEQCLVRAILSLIQAPKTGTQRSAMGSVMFFGQPSRACIPTQPLSGVKRRGYCVQLRAYASPSAYNGVSMRSGDHSPRLALEAGNSCRHESLPSGPAGPPSLPGASPVPAPG